MAASDHLENVVASSGDFVANGNLIFSAGNGFLKLLLARAEERYTGQGWNSLGEADQLLQLYFKYFRRSCSTDRGNYGLLQGWAPDRATNNWASHKLLEFDSF